jgi:hypothetical protein
MARQGNGKSRIARAGNAVRNAAKKVGARLRPAKRQKQETKATPAARAAAPRKARESRPARPQQRTADVPLDILNRTYTPKQTSLKASFRASGDERQRDQEFAGGFADERFNDEDRYTNKSGDPRIGTHHRRYEPGE